MANQGNPMGNAPQQPRMSRPMPNNPGLRHLLQQVRFFYGICFFAWHFAFLQQSQYNRQMMGMPGMGACIQRPQMGQQMQNPNGNPQNTFDDVNNYDFMQWKTSQLLFFNNKMFICTR